ncbi:MAG: roadblock/LC7 domain-containing protein [Candidatus Micrarchaeota archaeon]
MKVSRKDLLYWGTIAIITFFFLEFFWPMMYSQEQAAPIPSPETPKEFNGRAIVPAKIVYFSSEGFVSCNNSKQGFIDSLRATQGVQNVFAVSENGFVLKVNSSDENATAASFAALSSLASADCGEGSIVLRNAGLELDAGNMTFQSLESFNDSRTLYLKDVADAFRSLGASGVQGFVESALSVNETIQAAVTVKMLGTRIVDKPQVEQLRFTKPFAQ